MTFDEFVKKYNGKATDYDGGCGAQCVDTAKLYMDKVLGIKIGAIGNAEAYWRRYNELPILKNNFDRIPNTPDFIPQKGDIVVWDLRHGKYGHIAIADGVGTTSYFYSYDQNWGGKAMKRVKHTYKDGFAGVLRPKKNNVVTQNPVQNVAKYSTGTYQTTANVNVRTGAGTNYKAKTAKELTTNAREQNRKLGNGNYNGYLKGVVCTVTKVEGNWGLTSSGWICLDYAKKR